ncbi:peptide/nickel transport system ATP-binding protein/oligopeptide transport system ATP-binding protein [Melghirimyces profundicolus]|uniref:Peptide/nickel transport system ATP-binding protein/oligopeptide transport system ATP-binding protein n=1 Tax=Melghirimyces profundicolus TaxID=1242148 RepID=A0A2T6C7L7_9BACL|nr:ABC transporter ATP-binding protein [Melghirimyces profundicolus]PTX64283.1 peptide/nickel transport system ATP-binding protein/oligopeptide transport system ATP-binding protein [Melghirimyces profundicolus]
MKSVLDIKNLKVGFHSDEGFVQAVDGLDLQIGEGKTLGLVGESGCGKSVTSLSVMRLLPEKARISGEIGFLGEDLLQKDQKELERIRGDKISMIFQDPMTSLNPVLTIGEQIEEVIRYHQGGTKQEIRDRTLELMDLVKIPDSERRIREYPHQMSGGIRQRIMIAMAIACDPELLIADEPTTALDVTVQAQILALIRELQEKLNTAVLMISHDLGVISQVADDVAVMYAGQVVEWTTTEELFESPKHPYTQGLIRTIPRMDEQQGELEEIPGMVPELSQEFKGCRFYDRCPKAMKACKKADINLLDVEQSKVRCLLYSE